ncbi:hypothetical protein FB567DRAFT_607615 [Paraphoma chrysanthemicola]|uniref:Uncharacterized protein n=1 Tax=Paraphoma chrysanthemicola TaxID=798071 RepID=A0A8K0VUI1_9PLEO|nr:hypothetical protein FB567DRAFT_607615 [Paraphoma chrysanthemicola]
MAANDNDEYLPAKWHDFLLRPLSTWLANPNNEPVMEDSRYVAVTTMNCMLLNERQQPEDVIWGNHDPDIMDRKRTYLSPNISTFDAAWPHPRFICYSGEINVTQFEFVESLQGHSQVVEVTSLPPLEQPVVCDSRKALSLLIMPFLLIMALWWLFCSWCGRTGRTGARHSSNGCLSSNVSRGANVHDAKDAEARKKLQDMTTERNRLQSEVRDLNLQLDIALGRLSRVDTRTTSLELDLIKSRDTEASLQPEVKRLTTEDAKLRHDLEAERIEPSRKREHTNYLNDGITSLAAEKQDPNKRLQDTVTRAKNIITEREKAHASESEADKKADELRSLVQRAENATIAANDRAEELEHDIRNVYEPSNEDLADVLEQRNNARKAVDGQSHEECKKRIVELQQQLSDADAALENEKNESKKKQDGLMGEVQDAKNELELGQRRSREAIDDLKRRPRDSQAALDSMGKECTETQDGLEKLEGEYQRMTVKLEDAETERDALRKQVEDTAAIIAEISVTGSERDTSENQTSSEVEQLQASLAFANNTIEELVNERDDAKDECEQTKVQLQGVEEEIERLRANESHAAPAEDGADDLSGDEDINTKLRAKLAEAHEQLEQSVPKTDLEEAKKKLDRASTSTATRIAVLEEEVQKQKQLADDRVEENIRSKTRISALVEEMGITKELCQTKSDRVEELEKEIAELEGRLEDIAPPAVTPETQVKERLIDELQNEIAKLKKELETASTDTARATADLTVEKNKVEELRQVQAENEKIDAELVDSKDALKELQENFDQNTKARNELEKNSKVHQETRKMQEKHIEDLNEQLKKLRSKINELETVRKEREEKLEEAEQQLQQEKEQNETTANTAEKFEEANTELEAEVNAAHIKINEMQAAADDSVDKIKQMEDEVEKLKMKKTLHDDELHNRAEQATTELQEKLKKVHKEDLMEEKKSWEAKTTADMEKMLDEKKEAYAKKLEEEKKACDERCTKEKEQFLAQQKAEIEKLAQDDAAKRFEEEKKKLHEEAEKKLEEHQKEWHEQAEKKCAQEKKALLEEHNAKQEKKKPEDLFRPKSSSESTFNSPHPSPNLFQNQETEMQEKKPVNTCNNCGEPMPKGFYKHLKTCKNKKIKDAGTELNNPSAASVPPWHTEFGGSILPFDSRPTVKLPPRQNSLPMSVAQRHGPPTVPDRPQVFPDGEHAVHEHPIDTGPSSRTGGWHESQMSSVSAGGSPNAEFSPTFGRPRLGEPQSPLFGHQGQGTALRSLSATGSPQLFTASPQGMSPTSTGSLTGNMGQGLAAPPSVSDPGSVEPQSQPSSPAQELETQGDSTPAPHLIPLPGSQPTSPNPSDGEESSEIDSTDAELSESAVSPTETSAPGLGADIEEIVVPKEPRKEADDEGKSEEE